MRMLSFISALLLASTPAVNAWGADLTKIDRTIAKEPAYQSRTPKYGLLVFGPEAKSRAWRNKRGRGSFRGEAMRPNEGMQVTGPAFWLRPLQRLHSRPGS